MVFMASSLGEKIWHGPAQEEQRVEIPKGIGPIDDNRQARITGDRSQRNPNRGGFEDCGLSQCTHPTLAQSPGAIVHLPRGSAAVPEPMVLVVRYSPTWPSWKR